MIGFLLLITAAVTAIALSAMADGVLVFTNALPIFGPGKNPCADETPGPFTGQKLSGDHFLAQVYGSYSTDVLRPISVAGFRTRERSGFIQGVTLALPGSVEGPSPLYLQLRVWDNSRGLYSTWPAAESAWHAGEIAAGISPLYVLTNGVSRRAASVQPEPGNFNIFYLPKPSAIGSRLLSLGSWITGRRNSGFEERGSGKKLL